MMAVEFAKLVKNARQRAGSEWWDARCPGHDDRRASLSFCDGDHALVVECHAGCSRERIAAAVGRRIADFAHHEANGGPRERRREVATYDYHDEQGEFLYQVVRYEPKDFLCRRPDGCGGWVWSLGDGRIVPYRLHELAEARRVYIPEGEKDCDTLAALGLTATTNHGGAGKWREAHTAALVVAAIPEAVVLRDNDRPGAAHQDTVVRSCVAAGLCVKRVMLPGLPPLREKHGEDVTDWLAAGHSREELESLADAAPLFMPADADGATPCGVSEPSEPELRREGLDLALVWPDGIRFTLATIRDGRDGVRGELTVTRGARRLSWGSFALSSTQARETLRRKLIAASPEPRWGDLLEEVCWRLTQAAREGEPLVTLTGTVTSPTRELMPRLLYEGEPTLIYGDGDTGKSLVALALAVVVQAGAALPFGLKPARAVPAAYLDWETTRDTIEARLALIAAGLGIDPPGIVYKRMTRPLVDEAAALAADFARRGIGFVVIDSKMFAVAGGEGAAFHEPIVSFYNALRLFAPAASLVLNHITGADARGGGPARPFGGAFAFNGPRLIWEAKRDHDITDATAIAFTCRKANNLPRRPEPFGLRFVPGEGTVTVYPLDLTEAAPQTVAGAGLPYRLRLALAQGDDSVESLAERVGAKLDHVRVTLHKLKARGLVVTVPDTKPIRWSLVPR